MNPNVQAVIALADGARTSVEIASAVGLSPRYVRRIMTNHNLPRLPEGGRPGENNHQFVCGRRISHNGYAVITPPAGHPTARPRPGRASTTMFEHRFVAEQKLGRPLRPSERVDHVDGLTLHNSPDNLRVFDSNAEHLRATLTGKVPRWSDAGYANMKLRHHQPEALQQVDIHRQRRAAGACRLRQILLAALSLGTDSPYLSGTLHHTKKAGIDMSSRSTIERALADLCQRWGWPQTL